MSEYHLKARRLSQGHSISPSNRVSRRLAWLRVVILGIAYVARVSGLQAQGLWRDEVDQWRFAFEPMSSLIANFTRPGWNGPLYSPLLRGWIALAGDSVYAMRYLSLVWGILSVAVCYALAARVSRRLTRMWGAHAYRAPHWVGSVMALLMAGAPYLVYYAQEIKMYTWVPLLALLALYALDRAAASPHVGLWLGVWLSVTLAFYSHIFAALLIPVAVIWFLLHPARSRRAWTGGLITLAGLTLPYLPLLSWQTALALVPRETGYPHYSLLQMARVLLDAWSTGIWQGAWEQRHAQLAMMIFFGVPAGIGFLILLLSRQFKSALRLVAWLALPLFAVWLVSLRGPVFTDRYLIWSAPAFYLLVAIGIVWLRCVMGRVTLVALVTLLILNGHGIAAQMQHPLKPEFPKVVRSVEARREPKDLLLFQIPYNHYVYEFYAEEGLGRWAEAPFTNWREPDGSYTVNEDSVARDIRQLLRGYDRVWLVYSEAALWDDRDLVRAWLDETYDRLDSQSFHGVELYLYRRRGLSN